MNDKELFDAIRARKGAPLTQADVDAINAIIGVGRAISEKGLALIKSFEGCELTAYPDPGTGGDPWTIGWGHTGPEVRKGLVWTQAQADAALAKDVSRFSAAVDAALRGAPTTQGQFDAMVSLAYNIGIKAFVESTLLRFHKAGDIVGAAAQFARWNKAAGRVLAGLTRRRAAEAALYRGAA